MSRALFFAAFLLYLPLNAQRDSARPKIYAIAYVRFKATDLEKSRQFYGKTLGLRGGFDDCKDMPGLCYIINTYQHVELVQAGSRERDSFLEEIGFVTSSVSQMREHLLSRGQAPGPILRGPNGLHLFEISDPEGN